MEQTGSAAVAQGGRNLYTVGGALALLCAVIYLITLGVYIPVNRAGTSPGNVLDWFQLFHIQPLTGLFLLGLADVVIMLLWVPIFLALFTCLRRYERTWLLIGSALVFIGVAVYLATNSAFSMLSLSRLYTEAATDLERTMVLSAGRAMIAISEGTGGRYTGMALAWLGAMIFSIIMRRSRWFGKATAWVGILGMGFLVASMPFAGYTSTGAASPVVGAIVAVTYIGGGLLSFVWYILTGLDLIKLGRMAGQESA